MFDQRHIPAILLLWRASALAMQATARRAADGRTRNFTSKVARRGPAPPPTTGATSRATGLPLTAARLSLPSTPAGLRGGLAAGGGAGCGSAGGRSVRSMSHWAGVRSRMFPALRLAGPVTAACIAAAAAGAHGHYHSRAGSVSGLHDRGAASAHFANHGSPSVGGPLPPADMRACRELLEEKGFAHPGMQPGAAWGAIPASSQGKGEMHAMFEYLLLFPA